MSRQQEGASDLYAARRRKRRLRMLRRSALFLAIAGVLLLLYQKRDVWIPRLETIGSKHQSLRGDGSVTDGEFPLQVYGGEGYQIGKMNQKLLVLSDSYLNIYETNGSLHASRQHTYGSPMLRYAGGYALVYESGGTRFRLDNSSGMKYEKSIADSIIFGRVSENGEVLLVTSSESCACRLLVFNVKGQGYYERNCVEDITEAEFLPDGSGCYAVSIRVKNGAMQSVVHAYSFKSGDLWSSQPLDMLVISVYNTDSGLFLLGDEAASYLDSRGAVKSTYRYPDTLAGGDCIGDTAAVLLRNDDKHTYTVAILNGDAANPLCHVYDKTVKSIGLLPDSKNVLVQLRAKLESLHLNGTVGNSAPVADSCSSFLQIGSYVFLTGYDRIDRVSFKG
ncbi:MAG: hypothetical protein II723_04025 [Oscillospiraceae bacterium]|nr:hypothetical protein [Oscillospiraceae bacterium]